MKTYEPDPDKVPAAVVLVTRGPLVLALTCKGRIADLQLPGGKWESDVDGIGLVNTAARELKEETGVEVSVYKLMPLVEYVAHTGRPVHSFWASSADRESPDDLDSLTPTDAGWPGWVEPEALLSRWCTYREEAAHVIGALRQGVWPGVAP